MSPATVAMLSPAVPGDADYNEGFNGDRPSIAQAKLLAAMVLGVPGRRVGLTRLGDEKICLACSAVGGLHFYGCSAYTAYLNLQPSRPLGRRAPEIGGPDYYPDRWSAGARPTPIWSGAAWAKRTQKHRRASR